jgi:hypothetical protein
VLTLIQVLWTVLLTLWAGYLIWLGNPVGFALGALAIAHGYVTLALRRQHRWAWWASWPLPLAALALVAPRDIYNYFLFFSGDPRYLDSPGTILVVTVSTVIFVVPALAIAALLVVKWRSLAPNSTPHTDARASAVLDQPPPARAGERGR